MHYYALIKYKYALKEKWMEICKYMQHKNFAFVFYMSKNEFLSYSATFIIKGKNMQMHEHPPFNNK
jgi:hypothetical protein